MYDKLISQVPEDQYPNVVRVLQNLRFASQEAHLPAFQAAAENGGTLTPQRRCRIFRHEEITVVAAAGIRVPADVGTIVGNGSR